MVESINLCGEEREVNTRRNGTVDINIEELVAVDGMEYICLDSVFQNDSSDLQGAKYNSFVPVCEEEHDRRKEEMRDFEWSPLAHIYEEQSPRESWEEWIETELRHGEIELLYDQSYICTYEEQLNEQYYERHGETPFIWECVGGGRMGVTDIPQYNDVLRSDLIHLAHSVENGGTWVFDALDSDE